MLANDSRESILPPYPGSYTGYLGTDGPSNSRPLSAKGLAPNKYTHVPQKYQKRSSFFYRYAGIWRALPAVLAVIIWSTQMIYFFFWFITRPANEDGSWHRIGASYAAWPFISCIGAERQLCFKLASIIVACLLWTTFGIDYFIGRKAPVGKWLRLGKMVFSSISSAFLIALAFSSVDGQRKNHLIFTSFQIILMAFAKVCDWYLNRTMREWLPNNRHLQVSKAWKRVAASIAPPAGLLVMLGIYGCTAKFVNDTVVFTSQCWSLVSFAATAEWTLSTLWMIFVGTVAYDNYHLENTVQMLLMTPRPLKREKNRLGFWATRWFKTNQGGHDLENWGGRPEARRVIKANTDLDQETRSMFERDSIVGGMDEPRVEEYSPLQHQGRTVIPSIPSRVGRDLSNRGYQQVSSSPYAEGP
ncbi:uncharacterized protein A1O9_12513 [Exophiala aquamarina CBS 119918]|uniref:CWH43-like N-terminal domain-containing protein n=1 Tax=Exophiala aquamarina CBS 119918 TaxID=1182545 RepID=A0A072NU31_9EURO|nr:uncharacterized protein A1O9_12513 [Exophiala aquamarina CBS 119918]KEF51364.1 hypothetical protein A1O9_12513 [Exophiala aquamarina CBS 119918]